MSAVSTAVDFYANSIYVPQNLKKLSKYQVWISPSFGRVKRFEDACLLIGQELRQRRRKPPGQTGCKEPDRSHQRILSRNATLGGN